MNSTTEGEVQRTSKYAEPRSKNTRNSYGQSVKSSSVDPPNHGKGRD